jgi:glutamine phosphoribosylpyrophosphate amidotransferase
LAYISLENLKLAIDAPEAGFCDACLTGHYPVPVPVDLGPAPARADDHRPARDALQPVLPGV